MTTPEALRALLVDDAALVRAVASGRQRGAEPRWRRIEARYVDLAAGRRLQVTRYDDTQSFTSNHETGDLDDLLAEPMSNWHVETATHTHQLRITKKGRWLQHSSPRAGEIAPDRSHDRAKQRLLSPDAPVLAELGITDAHGRIKPSRQAKYRQVEEFLRALDAALEDAWAGGHLRQPTADRPLRVVDLGCGNAYLSLAAVAHREDLHMTGVDSKQQSREHNEAVADRLGWAHRTEFVVSDIAGAEVADVDVVLALHACDTATDDALARAVEWQAPVVLAAPCCHHDIATQLRGAELAPELSLLVRDGIVRERFADTLTDTLRADLLRQRGYRVDVMEFVESKHTPRNTLLRAVRTGHVGDAASYDHLVGQWRLRPRLGELLG